MFLGELLTKISKNYLNKWLKKVPCENFNYFEKNTWKKNLLVKFQTKIFKNLFKKFLQ